MSGNWYIGQKVVSVQSGNIFTITAIDSSPCKCSGYYIETDEMANHVGVGICNDCKTNISYVGRYRHSDLFRPIEDNFAEETLSKAIEHAEEIHEIIETIKTKEYER